MASNKNKTDTGKVSSLTGLPGAGGLPGVTGRVDSPDKQKNYGTAALTTRAADKKSMAWLADIIIILLIAGAAVLAWLYVVRPLMRAYRQSWEEREIVYVLEIADVDPDLLTYDRDGDPELVGQPVLSAPRDDADVLGTVTDAETVVVIREDGSSMLTLRLTVEASVRYRAGDGYSAGDTRLLCGEVRTFRLWGLTADGMILSLHTSEELTTDAEQEPADEPAESED